MAMKVRKRRRGRVGANPEGRINLSLHEKYRPAWQIVHAYAVAMDVSNADIIGRALHCYAEELVRQNAVRLSDTPTELLRTERALLRKCENLVNQYAKRRGRKR